MDLKKRLILYVGIFLILSIFFVSGIIGAGVETGEGGSLINAMINPESGFVGQMLSNFINPFHSFSVIFSNNMSNLYWNIELVILVIYGISIMYIELKRNKSNDYTDIEMGSSDWAKGGEEFKKAQDGREILNKKDGFILSKNHFLGTDQNKIAINKNILVFGGSGTGKTACYIKPNVLQMLGSYVITDPKGELYRDTSQLLQANGYEIKVLNFIDPSKSNSYNPLAHIQDTTDVDIVAHTIIAGSQEDGKSSDPFWDNTAIMLLKATIYYLISKRPVEEQNLSSALAIVRAGGSDDSILDKLFIDELTPDNPGRREYESIRLGAENTKKSIAISVASKLGHFDSPSMKSLTGSNDISFEDLGKKKVALYVISPDSHSTYNYILTIFYAQLLQKLYALADRNGGSLAEPVYLMLDEFPNIGKIPDFNQKLSTSRSRGISMSIVVQSLDQLIDLFKDLHENIIANCDTQLFLGSQSIKTCEYISKSLGQKTLKFENQSRSEAKDFGDRDSYSYSIQRQARELMTVDELKRMGSDDEIIIIRGLRPIKAKKAWFFKYHPLKDVVGQYKIKNIDDMPEPKKAPMEFFNVESYLRNRSAAIMMEKEKLKEEVKRESKNDIKFDLGINDTTNDSDEEIDIQKELEKKFDELFGTTNGSSNDI